VSWTRPVCWHGCHVCLLGHGTSLLLVTVDTLSILNCISELLKKDGLALGLSLLGIARCQVSSDICLQSLDVCTKHDDGLVRLDVR